ncbi:MAG: pilus assembly protein CpaE [Paracoccaceae bacterium]|jgi:pilus assembly protein CpaE
MQLPRLKGRQIELFAIADDFALFGGISDDLDAEFGADAWSWISQAEATRLLAAGLPPALTEVIIAVDAADEGGVAETTALVATLKKLGVPVILLLKDVGPVATHALLRAGADDFLPYPTPEGALPDTLQRLRDRAAVTAAPAVVAARKGAILPVYSMSGGAGGTTFAVNLAWELAIDRRKSNQRVCLLDFDFQFGSVSTYLDMPRQEALMELLSSGGPGGIERDALASAFSSYKRKLSVMTAPADAMPMDIISSEEVARVLTLAAAAFDFVVIDMPHTLTNWTETVLSMSETFFAVSQIDMRSAQNTLRFLRLLKSEDLPLEKLEFIMNRAPGFTDIGGKGRVRKMAESLGIEYSVMLPDGGKQVTQACDHGQPLAEYARGNALRKEIRKVALAIKTLAEQRQAGAL